MNLINSISKFLILHEIDKLNESKKINIYFLINLEIFFKSKFAYLIFKMNSLNL